MRTKNIVTYFMVILTILQFASFTASAQTLHAIIACNTIDKKIGDEMAMDMKNVRNHIQTIAYVLDCEYDEYALDGPICTKAKITEIVKNMDIDPNDIVLFYYGGHGTHAINNAEDPWPQMCMNTNIQSLFLPVKTLDNLISSRNPRLQIMIMDCCNKEQEGITIKPLFAKGGSDATILSSYNPAILKKLFFESKGKVKITSSELGQYSWSQPNGSLFTNHMIEILDEAGTGKLANTTWQKICEEAQKRTFAETGLPDGARQKPYFRVNIDEGPTGNIGTGNGGVSHTTSANSLFKSLQTLIDSNQTKDKRLSNIVAVRNKFFTNDAHVVTVGKNGTSKIMYEDVDAFLRRLALSSNIKQINVLEGTDNGKNSMITVHEVRY